MQQLQAWQNGSVTCWYDAAALPEFSATCFDAAYWQQRDAVLGQSRGRGITWFVQGSVMPLVLRHYWRGGLMGKLLGDRFFYCGLKRTRCRREYALLTYLADAGLPVPRAVGARVVRRGLCYRADLLLERIPEARDLVCLLRERPLTAEEWARVGGVIRQLHDVGAWHSDLNSHNLMLDAQGKVWVIDFDKCDIRGPGPWQQQMLDRLLRSLRKELICNVPFYWQESDWPALLAGYQAD